MQRNDQFCGLAYFRQNICSIAFTELHNQTIVKPVKRITDIFNGVKKNRVKRKETDRVNCRPVGLFFRCVGKPGEIHLSGVLRT